MRPEVSLNTLVDLVAEAGGMHTFREERPLVIRKMVRDSAANHHRAMVRSVKAPFQGHRDQGTVQAIHSRLVNVKTVQPGRGGAAPPSALRLPPFSEPEGEPNGPPKVRLLGAVLLTRSHPRMEIDAVSPLGHIVEVTPKDGEGKISGPKSSGQVKAEGVAKGREGVHRSSPTRGEDP